MIANTSILSDIHQNDIRLSNIQAHQSKVHFKGFSAKYVVEGLEHYIVNNKKKILKKGEYLVGNSTTEGSVLIDSTQPVQGICIDISQKILQEVIDFQYDDSYSFQQFLFEKEWVTNTYKDTHTTLGKTLQQIGQHYESLFKGAALLNTEVFYSIAECIVHDQSEVFRNFQKLNAVKEETNGKLFHFIYDAKCYMDTHFLEKIAVETIAQNACLSEYHFIRLFKKVIGLSPYQYILKQRLALAADLLKTDTAILEIAVLTGFADIASFSKAFKLQFGCAPRYYKHTN